MPAGFEDRDTMYSASNIVPWHRHGEVVRDALTAADALVKSGQDFEVVRQELFLAGPADLDGIPRLGRKVPNVANVRADDGKVLGVVGPGYQILQNKDAFAFADALVDDGSAKYETAGTLSGGRVTWLMMNIPAGIKVAGDEDVDLFLALRNSHDGSSKVTVMVTPVRIVCQNTLNWALSSAKRVWGVTHSGDINSKLLEARKALELTFEYVEEFKQVADDLAMQEFTERAFRELAIEIAPDDNQEKHRDGMLATFVGAPNLEHVRNTKYAAVNAVGEYWQHGRSIRTDEAALNATFNGIARQMQDSALEYVQQDEQPKGIAVPA